jgi:hypothetical protein
VYASERYQRSFSGGNEKVTSWERPLQDDGVNGFVVAGESDHRPTSCGKVFKPAKRMNWKDSRGSLLCLGRQERRIGLQGIFGKRQRRQSLIYGIGIKEV